MKKNWKRDIVTIWVGQSVSLLTSSVMQMSLIWYLTATTGSALVLTFATIAGYMPYAFMGTFAGVFIDRFDKKKILIFADLFIALISIVLAVSALMGELHVWIILVALVFRSIGMAFHEPTAQALMPLFVPQKNLAQASGFVQAFDSISMLLSPSIAILLYEIWDLHFVLAIDAVGASIAIVLLLFIKFPKQKIVSAKEKPIKLLEETKEGIKVIRSYEGIFALVIIGVIYTIIYSPIGSLYPHITMVYFGGSTAQSGFVEIIFSSGSLLGALVLGVLGAKLPKSFGLIGSIFLYGLGVFLTGSLSPDGYWIFVVLSFIVGFSIPFYHGIVRTIFQTNIKEEFLGRAFALSQSARRLAMPIGLLLGGVFSDVFGVNIIYMIAGLSAMVLALFISRLKSFKHFRRL